MKKANYNSTIALESEIKFDISNRSFLYGDGFFETMRFQNGQILFFADHFSRLTKGMSTGYLSFNNSFTEHYFEKAIKNLCNINEMEDARVKILVWRKSGGLFSAESKEAEFLITCTTFNPAPAIKQKVTIARNVQSCYSNISSYKSTSALKYIIAGMEMKEKSADDILLLDPQENISECLSSNIFWIKDDIFFTPSLLTGCIDGIMKNNLIRKLKGAGIEVIEGSFHIKHLLEADSAFTTNITGISTILSINEKKLKPIPEALNTLITRNIK